MNTCNNELITEVTIETMDVAGFTSMLDQVEDNTIECQTGTLETEDLNERFVFVRSVYDGFAGLIVFTDKNPVVFKSGFPLKVDTVINGVLENGGQLKNIIWGKGTPWRVESDEIMKHFHQHDLGAPNETTFLNLTYDRLNHKLIYCYGEVKLKKDGKFKPKF